jgi:hypothetical protein
MVRAEQYWDRFAILSFQATNKVSHIVQPLLVHLVAHSAGQYSSYATMRSIPGRLTI